MARRWTGWAVVCVALAALVAAYLTDTKERRGRLSPPPEPAVETDATHETDGGPDSGPGEPAEGPRDAGVDSVERRAAAETL